MTDLPQGAARRFLELWEEVAVLDKVEQVLSWDAETQMPPGGDEARAAQRATLAGLRHARLASDELHDALERAAAEAEPESVLAAQVREARRVVRRTRRIPERLAREQARARSLAHRVWSDARAAADFARFRDALAQLVALAREEAACLAADFERPYDALLDSYEPGARTSELTPLFAELAAELGPLVRAVADCGREVDESPARGHWPEAAQLALGRELAEAMGFDFRAGRLDRAVHPFCTGFAPGDVRLTWRSVEDDFRPGLFGILHEAGHGLYEQGLPVAWQGTPIGGPVSLGVHESQSRLWENMVGRSRAFWRFALPRLHEHFPAARSLALDELAPTLRTVRPSLIRVEADEGTYDLHVLVRFELERALFAGELEVDDLPGAWDDAYERHLGLRPPDAAQGVLQDIHWSMGAFGYFPTYTLGNLMMAQLWSAAEEALGALDEALARGELRPLLDWLREHVHRHGSRYPAAELIERATGRPLGVGDYLAHRARAVEQVYGIRPG